MINFKNIFRNIFSKAGHKVGDKGFQDWATYDPKKHLESNRRNKPTYPKQKKPLK